MHITTRLSDRSEAAGQDVALDLLARALTRWLTALDSGRDSRVYADANRGKEEPAW